MNSFQSDTPNQNVLWCSGVPIPNSPNAEQPNSKLRIACVVGNNLYESLRPEAEMLLLTAENWLRTLKYSNPDIVLLESCWQAATGDWYLDCTPYGQTRDSLLELLDVAQELSIPVVFWSTLSNQYGDLFLDLARRCDHVFCADVIQVEKWRSASVKAELLSPAIQPALFNRFGHVGAPGHYEFDILFDGWNDILNLSDGLSAIDTLCGYGLAVFDSERRIARCRKDENQTYAGNVEGCIEWRLLPSLLGMSNAMATTNSSLRTTTLQQWRVLEAAAAGVPIVHHGQLPDDDVRASIVRAYADEADFHIEFIRIQKDQTYRDRLAQIAWREVYENHTFAHRLRTISKHLQIEFDWAEYPNCSLVSTKIGAHNFDRCLAQYECQRHPNKEWVFLSSSELSASQMQIVQGRADIRLISVPQELSPGAQMNLCAAAAMGEYLIPIEPSYLYGDRFVSDAMLHLRSLETSLFTKPHRHRQSELVDDIDHLDYGPSPLTVVAGKNLPQKPSVALCGETSFFRNFPYDDIDHGFSKLEASEEIANQSIAVLDAYNMVPDAGWQNENLASAVQDEADFADALV